MNNKVIANKVKILAEEIQVDSDYVYDPSHQNRPHGGGQWYKTEKGWTTHKPLRNPHKKTPSDTAGFGMNPRQKELAKRAKSKDPMWRIKVAKDHDTHPTTLDELSQDDNWLIRAAVAENPNVSQHALEALSEDDNWVVQHRVAKNTETPDEVLDKMSKSDDWRVRVGVTENLNAPDDILKSLADDANEEVRNSAKETLEVKSYTPEQKKLAQNAKSSDFTVRRAVAGNPETPKKTPT